MRGSPLELMMLCVLTCAQGSEVTSGEREREREREREQGMRLNSLGFAWQIGYIETRLRKLKLRYQPKSRLS